VVEAFSPDPPKIDEAFSAVAPKIELPVDDTEVFVPKIELEVVAAGALAKTAPPEEAPPPKIVVVAGAAVVVVAVLAPKTDGVLALVDEGVIVEEAPPKMELEAGVEELAAEVTDANKGFGVAWVATPSSFFTGSIVAAVVVPELGALVEGVTKVELSFWSPLPKKVELAAAVPAPNKEVATLPSLPKGGPFA
jgi:hypothetical protein